jgi:23S rRNA (adenine2503-C2)-methyltransferase
MLKDVNDRAADAKALVGLLKGIPARSISFRSTLAGTRYECSDWGRIEKFSEIIFNAGYASPGAHAARTRHSRRLRPAQERQREALRA